MFENVREWLGKGIWEKIIGFLILYIAIYGIVWGVIEPLISSNIVEKYFGQDALKYWWKYQLSISAVISIIIFIWLLPNKILQTFGSEFQDTKLDVGFTPVGNPRIFQTNDGYYGDVYQIEGEFSDDALNWNINADADDSSTVIYIYQPSTKFVLYLRLGVLSKNNTKEESKWIALRTDISIPIGNKGQEEWAFPVKGKNAKNGWIISQVNISKAVNETFGKEGYQYSKLKGIRIRGNGKVSKIIFRGKRH